MAVTHDDDTFASDTSSGDSLALAAMTTAQGKALVGYLGWEGSDANLTVSDDAGNQFYLLSKRAASNGDQWVQGFFAQNIKAQANNVITIQTSASVPFRAGIVIQYGSTAQVDAFNSDATDDDPGGTLITVGPLVLSAPQIGAAFAVFGKCYDPGFWTAGANMGNLIDLGIWGAEDRLISATGSYSADFEFSSLSNIVGVGVMIRENFPVAQYWRGRTRVETR